MNLAVFGANGRMGNALIEALTRHEEMALSAAFVRENHPLIGQRVSQQVADFHGEIRFTAVEQLQLRDVDVVIDFTLPE